jgi:riboflavin kinase
MSSSSEEDGLSKWSSLYVDTERSFVDNPILLEAVVVHGFKRGSKDLGIPTANLSMDQLGERGQSLETGIYFGWTLLRGRSYEAVASVGWNPFYKNTQKTVEVHILHELDDFYGETISVVLCGYLRQETNFNSMGKKKYIRYVYK